MFFKKKKPHRLYIPAKTTWYRKPKRQPTVGTNRKIFRSGVKMKFTRFFKDAFLYLVAGLILLALLTVLVFSNKFSVQKIEIARNDLYVNNAAVADLLDKYLGKSIFTFSKSNAQALIHEAYPEFSQIEIRKLLPDRIKVELQTYEIIANIKAFYTLPSLKKSTASTGPDGFDEAFGTTTASKEELTPIQQKALLNEIGQAIFDREANLDLMTITIEGLSQPIEDREFVIPKEDMLYITDAIKYLNNLTQLEVKGLKYLPNAHEIHITTKNNLTLWLITKKPYKDQLDRFNTAYKTAKLNEKNLAYIDLRIAEKVIYCPKDAECDK